MYLSDKSYSSLNQVFIENGLSIRVKSNYIVVESAEERIEERVSKIVSSIGFYPLMSMNKIDNKVAFTISPYRIPQFFNKPESVIRSHPKMTCLEESSCAEYLSFDEVATLLEESTFIAQKEVDYIEDPWLPVNKWRSYLSGTLNQGLLDIIAPYVKGSCPVVVEIGSGIGYDLPECIAKMTIRTQPSEDECQLLKKTIQGSVYQLSINGLYRSLIRSNKKVPLFFALDVFDVISFDKRKICLSQLSELQNSGDHILMMLDTNPCLDVTIRQLESMYPDHAIFPYFPLTLEPSKFTVLIVPTQYVQQKPSLSQIIDIFNQGTDH